MNEIEPMLAAAGLRIGIAQSRFNQDVGDGLMSACHHELIKLGVKEEHILLATVPGALEVPLALQGMAQTGKFDALIAIGSVIRGETYHFEVVANESARGLMDVQLESGVPIANAILTSDNEDQALARMHEKGAEAARVAIEMANLTKAIAHVKAGTQ